MFYTTIMVVVMITYIVGVVIYTNKTYREKFGCCR